MINTAEQILRPPFVPARSISTRDSHFHCNRDRRVYTLISGRAINLSPLSRIESPVITRPTLHNIRRIRLCYPASPSLRAGTLLFVFLLSPSRPSNGIKPLGNGIPVGINNGKTVYTYEEVERGVNGDGNTYRRTIRERNGACAKEEFALGGASE